MAKEKNSDLMEKIISLCKRRGFVFPGSEIYGGLANSWDYGPLGVELKNNIKNLWWKKFVQQRDDMVGIDAALIMNPKVWVSSGHLENFSDPLVECKKCHHRFREDLLEDKKKCPDCKGELTEAKQFNLMLKTFLGSVDGWAEWAELLDRLIILNKAKNYQEIDELIKFGVDAYHKTGESTFYFRPETAQAMFVDFKSVLDTCRKKIPFGIAQIGKAFRNEITPGNFIFRTREFEQMEIEYFIKEENWKEMFEEWRKEMWSWMTNELGLDKNSVHELDVPDGERAHYSKRTIDFEFDFPFGRKELYGLAYRTDFDLKNHFQEPPYEDIETKEKIYPHVIEPSLGVDRSVLAVLCNSYKEEDGRIFLKLNPKLAPYKAAVSCLKKNEPNLVKKAEDVFHDLKKEFSVDFDNRGNPGKFYGSQDEIGTPYCIMVDFQTLEDDTVTVRDRDTTKQERIKINDLSNFLKNEFI